MHDRPPFSKQITVGRAWMALSLAGVVAVCVARFAYDAVSAPMTFGIVHFAVAFACMAATGEDGNDDRSLDDLVPGPDPVRGQMWFNMALALFYCFLLPAIAKGGPP